MPTTAYCATLNNYNERQVEALMRPPQVVTYLVMGREKAPITGTPHLQIYFQLAKQVRMTTMKKWNDPWDKMHFEKSRGSDKENFDYCTKDNDYLETGTRKEMADKGARMDIEALRKDIQAGKTYEEIVDTHFELAMKYSRFIRERIQVRDSQKELSSSSEALRALSWRPWQLALFEQMKQEPHPRKILWIWSSAGKTGKSTTAKYLASELGACLIQPAKYADMAYLTTKAIGKIFVFDLSRTSAPSEGREHQLDGSYALAENLKNGIIFAGKYDSTTTIRACAHVVFFANWKPDMTKWSLDRYDIREITGL